MFDLPDDAGALTPLESAILRTVTYGDLFDYPLTLAEIHRYLEALSATQSEVKTALVQGALLPTFLSRTGDFYSLAGRESTCRTRQERSALARELWPVALQYGRLIANLPFVRMVAVTGSLTMDNVDDKADIDYLVVTQNGRVWLSRGLTIGVVHLAARRGYHLCPNYILARRALQFSDQNLYTAREVTQMIPLSGLAIYQQLRQVNKWTDRFLPNATGPPRDLLNGQAPRRHAKRLAELPLRTPLGQWLETWEMRRKLRKFQPYHQDKEAAFSADWCKGHFDAHSSNTLNAYQTAVHRTVAESGSDPIEKGQGL